MNLRAVALGLAISALVACGHKPPYSRANRPTAEDLLATARPQLDAVVVSDATIVLNRIARGDLAMLAQAPQRFRASVSKAGNELVTLAFTEEDYALRYLLDDLPTGFYSGAADPCAVEAMLGVPLTYDDLVAAVLGGAPVITGHTVVDQKWDRKKGHETLVLRNDAFEQELQFVFVGGQWRFKGTGLWKLSGDARGEWLWSLEHADHVQVGDAVLPGKTEVRAQKSKRGKNRVVINYKARDPNPAWAAGSAEGSGADGDPSDDGGADDWGGDGEGGGDDWGDEEDWEDEPAAEAAQTPEPAPSTLAQGPEKSNIPEVFRLEAAGLPQRGDLCR